MLAQQGDPQSQAYLRDVWIRSPERRQTIALGLSQFPSDENWDYLIRSMPVLESYAVPEVLKALRKVPAATDDAQALREVILLGLRMEADGQSPEPALGLLTYWTGLDLASNAGQALIGWQKWFSERFPDHPKAELPHLEGTSPWSLETLSEYFATSEGRKGDSEAGKLAYAKAQCADCHRMGSSGKTVGPDLTTIANRFTKREVLESILYPSHVISDQYRASRVVTNDGKVYTGLVTRGANGTVTIKDSQLKDMVVSEENVETVEPSQVSIMPSGLFDRLTGAEIRDLMTFLGYVPEASRVANRPDEATRKK
jgi:putative heme-binding domain-containing protein